MLRAPAIVFLFLVIWTPAWAEDPAAPDPTLMEEEEDWLFGEEADNQEIVSESDHPNASPPGEPEGKQYGEPLPLPSSPKGAAQLYNRPQEVKFGCKREYVYRDKVYTADSYHLRDGEKLRNVLKTVPEAVNELNIYQRNRRDLKTAAYVGSVGLGVMATGILLNTFFNNATEITANTNSVAAFSDYLFWGGIAVAIGSAGFTLAIMRTNELHLENATRLYNDKNHDQPVELLFSTGVMFDIDELTGEK